MRKYYRFDDPSNVQDAAGILRFQRERDPANSATYDAMNPEEFAAMAVQQGKWKPQTDTPPSLSGDLKKQWVDPAVEAGKSIWNAGVDFARGGTAGFLFKPMETVAKWTGYDTNTKEGVLPQLLGQFDSNSPHFIKPRSLSEVATVPDSTMGTIGNVTGQTAQLLIPAAKTAAIPEMLAKTAVRAGVPKVAAKAAEWGTRAAIEGGMTGTQSALQGNDPLESMNAAITSAALANPAYAATGKLAKMLGNKGRSWYQESLSIPQNTTLEYGEKLIERGLGTGTTVNEEGLKAAEKRFTDIVRGPQGMKAASAAADQRAALITPASSKSRVDQLVNNIAIPKDKQLAKDIEQSLIDEYFPGGHAISPGKAEELKEKFNVTLEKFYKHAKQEGASGEKIVDEVLNAFLSGIKDEQEQVITELVNVGGKQIPYREAARVAAMDRDLMSLIDGTLRSKRSGKYNMSSMLEGAAYGSFLKGSLFNPSQIATAEKWTRSPESLSKLGPKLINKGAKLDTTRGTRTIPLAGRVAGAAMTEKPAEEQDFSQERPWRGQ